MFWEDLWDEITDGFEIMWESIKFIFRHPLTLIPFFITWIMYGGLTIYIYNTVDFSGYETWQLIAVMYGFMVLFTALVSVSSLILLELIEQENDTGSMRAFKAIKDALILDLYKTIPVIIVWSVVKLGVQLLHVLANSLKRENGRSTFLSRIVERWADRIDKGVRLMIFLILPGIAWDDRGPRESYQNARYIYFNHFFSILTGYGLSRALSFVTFIPVVIGVMLILFLSLPMWTLLILLFYLGVAWSFGLMVEQLYCGELYLWYSNFETAVTNKKIAGEDIPDTLSKDTKPDFLKQFYVEDPFAKYDKQ